LLDIWKAEEIAGSGYYRLPGLVDYGRELTPGELLRLQELKGHAAGRVAADEWPR